MDKRKPSSNFVSIIMSINEDYRAFIMELSFVLTCENWWNIWWKKFFSFCLGRDLVSFYKGKENFMKLKTLQKSEEKESTKFLFTVRSRSQNADHESGEFWFRILILTNFRFVSELKNMKRNLRVQTFLK